MGGAVLEEPEREPRALAQVRAPSPVPGVAGVSREGLH